MTDIKTAVDWTEDRILALEALWRDGLSTREIGMRLGVTKNAVVGKVHRLGLPKRQSPIAPRPRLETEVVRLDALGAGMCSWPFGEPGEDDFHFCGDKVVPEKPYCAVHCARAYIKPNKERRTTAAA